MKALYESLHHHNKEFQKFGITHDTKNKKY
jgi:hypothetical protein